MATAVSKLIKAEIGKRLQGGEIQSAHLLNVLREDGMFCIEAWS